MPHRKLLAYAGNRGLVLGLLGVIWLLTGIGLASDDRPPTGLVDEQLPLLVRVAMWALPGAFAIVAVAWRRLDGWAWPLLIAPVGIRLCALLWAIGPGPGPSTVWRGVLVYLAVGFLIDRCAAGLDRPAPWNGTERRWTPQP